MSDGEDIATELSTHSAVSQACKNQQGKRKIQPLPGKNCIQTRVEVQLMNTDIREVY